MKLAREANRVDNIFRLVIEEVETMRELELSVVVVALVKVAEVPVIPPLVKEALVILSE